MAKNHKRGGGYTPKNKLLKWQDVQAVFKEENKQGMVQEWIYNNKIKDRFRIGRTQFYKILKINVKAELEKLNNKENESNTNPQQITMDFTE